jgi:uncharacterized protein YbaR (Trm112 family)
MSDQPEEQFSAQLFCPVCCSVVYVDQSGRVELVCVSCGTIFEVVVDPEIVAEHSMVG